jgi:hypothetical protein
MVDTPQGESPVSDVENYADTTDLVKQFFRDPAQVQQSIVEIVYELDLEHRSIRVTADVETARLTAVYRNWWSDDEFDLDTKEEIDLIRAFLDARESRAA